MSFISPDKYVQAFFDDTASRKSNPTANMSTPEIKKYIQDFFKHLEDRDCATIEVFEQINPIIKLLKDQLPPMAYKSCAILFDARPCYTVFAHNELSKEFVIHCLCQKNLLTKEGSEYKFLDSAFIKFEHA